MIVVLDDDIDRISAFKTALPTCVCFQLPNDFIEFVKQNLENITCLSLDHDLGIFEHDMYGKREITGLDVSKELVNIIPNNMRIIIHSWNPDGAKRMKNVFLDAGFLEVKLWKFPWWQ